ncbi:unnamed protein product [Lasius platythorax]|uniref:Uncharacterized protein n=1 Tax=Lasius platythorax TaxID=488582 RepID=A0AAV2NYD3_9HYME
MRAFYTTVVLVILFASFTSSFFIKRQNDTTQILNFNDTTTSEVMESRIIFVPRRNKVFCEPGQQVDRRGKCRMVW